MLVCIFVICYRKWYEMFFSDSTSRVKRMVVVMGIKHNYRRRDVRKLYKSTKNTLNNSIDKVLHVVSSNTPR